MKRIGWGRKKESAKGIEGKKKKKYGDKLLFYYPIKWLVESKTMEENVMSVIKLWAFYVVNNRNGSLS